MNILKYAQGFMGGQHRDITSLANQCDVIIYDPRVTSIDRAKQVLVSHAAKQSNAKRKLGTRFGNEFIAYDTNTTTFTILSGMDTVPPDQWIDQVDMAANEATLSRLWTLFTNLFTDDEKKSTLIPMNSGQVIQIKDKIGKKMFQAFSTSDGWFDLVAFTIKKESNSSETKITNMVTFNAMRHGPLEHSGDRTGGDAHLHWVTRRNDLNRGEYIVVGAYGYRLKKLIDFTGKGLDPVLIVYDRTDEDNVKAIMVPCVLTKALIGDATFLPLCVISKESNDDDFYLYAPANAQGCERVDTGDRTVQTSQGFKNVVSAAENAFAKKRIESLNPIDEEKKETNAQQEVQLQETVMEPEFKRNFHGKIVNIVQNNLNVNLQQQIPLAPHDKQIVFPPLICGATGLSTLALQHHSKELIEEIFNSALPVLHVRSDPKWRPAIMNSVTQLVNCIIIQHCDTLVDEMIETLPFMAAGPRALCLLECEGKLVLGRTPCVSAWNGLLQHNHCQTVHLSSDTTTPVQSEVQPSQVSSNGARPNENYIWIYHLNKNENTNNVKFPDMENSIYLIEQNSTRYLYGYNKESLQVFRGLLPDNVKRGEDVTLQTSSQAIKDWQEINMITGQDVTDILSQSRIEAWAKETNPGFVKFCQRPIFTDVGDRSVLYKNQIVCIESVLTELYGMTLDEMVTNQWDIADFMAQVTVMMNAIELEKFRLPLYNFILGKISNNADQTSIKNQISELNKIIHATLKQNTFLEDVAAYSAEKKMLQKQLTVLERENNNKISRLLATILSAVSLKGTYSSKQIKARSLKAEQRKAQINDNVAKAKSTKSNEYFENFTEEYGAAIFDINSDSLYSLLQIAKQLPHSTENKISCGLAVPNSRAILLDETTTSCLIEMTNGFDGSREHKLMANNGIGIAQSNSYVGAMELASSIPIPLLKIFVETDDPSKRQWHLVANDSDAGVSTYRILFRGMIAGAIISRDFALDAKDIGVGYVVLEILLSCAERFVVQNMGNRIPETNSTQPCIIMRSLLGHILATMASTNATLCPGYKVIYNDIILSQISPIDFAMMIRLIKLMPYALWDTVIAKNNLKYYFARSVWGAMNVAIKPMIKEVNNDDSKKNAEFLASRQRELELLAVACRVVCRLLVILPKDLIEKANYILLHNEFPNNQKTKTIGERFIKLFESAGEFVNETGTTTRFREFAIDMAKGVVTGPQFQDIMYRAISCTFKRSAMFKKFKQTLFDAHTVGDDTSYAKNLKNMNTFYEEQVQMIETVCGTHYNVQKKSRKGYDPKPQNLTAFQTKSHTIQHDAEKNKQKIWALDNFDDVNVESIKEKVKYIMTGGDRRPVAENASVLISEKSKQEVNLVTHDKTTQRVQKLCDRLKDVSGNHSALMMIKEPVHVLRAIIGRSLGTTKDLEKKTVTCGTDNIFRLTDLLDIPREEVDRLVHECVLVTFELWRDNNGAVSKMVQLIKEKQNPVLLIET